MGARSSLYDQHSTGGIWHSADGGASWTKVFSKPVFDLRFRAPHLLAAVPWASDAESLYYSSDGGAAPRPAARGTTPTQKRSTDRRPRRHRIKQR